MPMGQWDVGPMMPGACALTGFVIVAVENLPEGQQFEAQRAGNPSLTRDARIISDSPDSHGLEIAVADLDQTGRPKAVWHVFMVNTVTGEMQVLGPDNKWESLQAWRAAARR
jgi:hypothetical protein